MSANTPQFASLGDVEEYIADSKVAWLQCRTKSHNMNDHDVKFDEGTNTYVATYRCTRCFTKRHEVVNADTGELLNVKYDNHPDGYLLPKGTGRLDSSGRGLIRVARLRNTMERKRDITELAAQRVKGPKSTKKAS